MNESVTYSMDITDPPPQVKRSKLLHRPQHLQIIQEEGEDEVR